MVMQIISHYSKSLPAASKATLTTSPLWLELVDSLLTVFKQKEGVDIQDQQDLFARMRMTQKVEAFKTTVTVFVPRYLIRPEDATEDLDILHRETVFFFKDRGGTDPLATVLAT